MRLVLPSPSPISSILIDFDRNVAFSNADGWMRRSVSDVLLGERSIAALSSIFSLSFPSYFMRDWSAWQTQFLQPNDLIVRCQAFIILLWISSERSILTLQVEKIINFNVTIIIITEEYPLALGKAVSKKDRDDMKTQLQSLVYGETEFRTLGYVFEKIKTVYGKPNQVRIKKSGLDRSRAE